MKITFKILLVLAVVVLGYLCIKSILDPIAFVEERDRRFDSVKARLIDVRTIQVEFRNQHGRYTASFDTLIDFTKNGRIVQIRKEGLLTDEQLQSGLTEAEAVKKGLIKRDTIYVGIKEALFSPSFVADSICFVPETGKKLEMEVGEITTASGIPVKLFECRTPYDVILHGLDQQEIINLKDYAKKLEKYPGLKVGSVTEINNNAGNWE